MSNSCDEQYLELLRHILEHGVTKNDRTGTGTKSVFGVSLRFSMQAGFPILTTKKMFFKGIVTELLWMLRGDTNIKYLNDNGVTIWNEWADASGNLGEVYGHQWCKWEKYIEKYKMHDCGRLHVTYEKQHVNQIQNVIDELKRNPDSRRLVVSAWNVADLDKMKLQPCHYTIQLYSFEKDSKRYLNLLFNMRSSDAMLGLPWNIAFYALLLSMIAQVTNHVPNELVYSGADVHLYLNHIKQAREQLAREPYKLPGLELNKQVTNIFDFKHEDIKLVDYISHQTIKAPIAV